MDNQTRSYCTTQGTLLSVKWKPGRKRSLGETGYMYMCDWIPSHAPGTTTALLIGYTPIRDKRFKKRSATQRDWVALLRINSNSRGIENQIPILSNFKYKTKIFHRKKKLIILIIFFLIQLIISSSVWLSKILTIFGSLTDKVILLAKMHS